MENQLQSDETLENMYFRKDTNELSQAGLPSEIPQIENGNKKRNACESITSNFQPTMREQSAQNGVTWAKWGEKGSPKAASKILKIKTLEERADRAVMSKAETSEETLIRRVRSTARLWHNMDNLPPKQFKRTSSLPTRSSRETYLETDPHSQGLSGHYKETYLIKKHNRFSPYGHPVL